MIQYKDVSFTQALAWLSEEYALVKDMDGNKYYTKEELINAKDIRPDLELGIDNHPSGGGALPEDPDRELFNFTTDHTE